MRYARPVRAPFLTILLLAAWACDSATGSEEVGSISLGSVDTELIVGSKLQLVATVLSPSGSVISGHPVSWSTSNPDVASVSASGLVTALAVGSTNVRAESVGRSASVTLTVRPGECTAGESVGSVSMGQERSGSLDAASCIMFTEARAEGWSLTLSSPAVIRVDVTSPAFQPHLVLTDLQMNPWGWGEWVGEGRARLVSEVPPGQYILWVLRHQSEPEGSYELSMSEAELCGAGSVTRTIRPGQTIPGSIDEHDCTFLHGLPAVGYSLELLEGTGLRLDLETSDFDAVLLLTDLEMEILWWDDDSGEDLNARIQRRLPAGEYIVWVTSWDGFSGSYQITAAEVEIEPCPVVGTLPLGATVSGALSGGSCADPDGRYLAPWSMTVTESTTVQLDLTSNQFDALLILEDEDGNLLDLDDDGGPGSNSRLLYEAGPGEYRVVVSTFWPGETGSYELLAQALGGGPGAVRTEDADAVRREGAGADAFLEKTLGTKVRRSTCSPRCSAP
jgi:hypothetical protein